MPVFPGYQPLFAPMDMRPSVRYHTVHGDECYRLHWRLLMSTPSRFREAADGLRVSDHGDVESCWDEHGALRRKTDEWRRLPAYPKQNGYLCVFFRGEQYVHRLVLEAFVGPCPPGMEARHVNGIKTDNRLVNLQWGTHRQNMRDKATHKMGTSIGRIPSYRRHRASGQAVVTLNGVDHYLGRFNSPESKAEYDR